MDKSRSTKRAISGILGRMKGEIHVCKNGLTALAKRESAFPLLSMQVWVETGSENEAEYQGSGVSHLLEHMSFKGAGEFSARQLNEEVSRLGGAWNAYTSTNRTVYHIDGPAAHWRRFLHILAQLAFRPAFPADEFEREREVIRREMAMYDDQPESAAYHALISTLYKAHPRRWPVVGERRLFDALSYDDMLAYYRRRYTPGNMFICLAGDVEPGDFFAALEEETASIPFCPAAPAQPEPEPRQWGCRLCRREFAQPTSFLMLAWRIPSTRHADTPALSVLNAALGEGRAAWLYKRFHDELGVAHDISSAMIPDKTGEGSLVIEADVDRNKRDALRDAVLEWLRNELPKQNFTAGLQRARRQIRTRRLRTLATVQGIAERMGMCWLHSRNLASDDEWQEAVAHVTAEDVARSAAAYFNTERLTEVSVDPVGSNPKPNTAADAASLPPPKAVTLGNGLRVVMRADARKPMTYFNLCLGGGAQVETEKNAGIGNLLAECMLKGSSDLSAAELADAVEGLGGSISCSSGNSTLSLSTQALKEDAETMLGLMAETALHPVFPEDAVATGREDMLADILDAEEDPACVAMNSLRRACFGSVSYGIPPEGLAEGIRNLTRADLVRHHARLMCARNAVLSIVGNFDADSMLRLADSLFGEGRMPAGQPIDRPATPPQQAGETTVKLGKNQGVLALALPGLSVVDESLPLQFLFDEWCRDMAGPIFNEIREMRGLAYYASSATLAGIDAGCLFFYLGTAPEKLPQARAALIEALESLAANGMPAEALDRARATAVATQLAAAQSGGKLCALAALDTLYGLPPNHSDRLAERLQAVTPERMNAYIRQTLGSKTRTICTVC